MGEGGESDTGGNTTVQPDSGWKPDDSDTLWGWLSNLVNGIGALVQDLSNIPSKIANSLKAFFDDVVNAITDLPNLILEGIKDIFIPDVTTLENQIDSAVENIASQLGVQFDTFDRLFDREVAPEDVNQDYNLPGVGVLNLKFFDTKYLIQGVAFFRPVIRGFMVLMLVFFVWKHIMTFIGQDPSIAHNAEQKYDKWNKGDKE